MRECMHARRREASSLRPALNAVLAHDMWVPAAHTMHDDFHARYSATSRRYSYYVGTDEGAASPFRRGSEWAFGRPLDRQVLDAAAARVRGEHRFRAFAVRGTAPAADDHRCNVVHADWRDRKGGLV